MTDSDIEDTFVIPSRISCELDGEPPIEDATPCVWRQLGERDACIRIYPHIRSVNFPCYVVLYSPSLLSLPLFMEIDHKFGTGESMEIIVAAFPNMTEFNLKGVLVVFRVLSSVHHSLSLSMLSGCMHLQKSALHAISDAVCLQKLALSSSVILRFKLYMLSSNVGSV